MRHSNRNRPGPPAYLRIFVHALIAFTAVLSIAAFPAPAESASTVTTPTLRPVTATEYQWGPYRPWRVSSGYLCIEQTAGVDSSGIPMYSAGHQWGDRSAAIWIRHENDYFTDDCWQNGYNTSQILKVEIVNNSDGLCFHFYRNVHPTTRVVLGTIGYLNIGAKNCWLTYERKANYASKLVGEWVGMATSNVTVSVMGPTWDTYSWPTSWDMAGLDREKYWFWRKA